MKHFASADEVYDTIGEFLAQLVTDPEMESAFVAAQTSFRISYHDPDAVILVDCTQFPPSVICGDSDISTEIHLRMSADDGHAFWMGRLSLTAAVAKNRVRVTGPMAKMMRLLPAIQPAFPKYNAFIARRG